MLVWKLRQCEGRGWVRDVSGTITGLEVSAGQWSRVEARELVGRLNARPGRVRVFAVEVEVDGPSWVYEP